MNLEGQIEIDITVHKESGLKDISLINNRPHQAAQLLVGKTVDEVLSLIPMLFHVCGKAQGAAAINAINMAQGQPVECKLARARAALVDVEFLREHLLRVFLDWPKQLPDGEKLIPQQALQSLMQSGPRFESALFGTSKPFSQLAMLHLNWDDIDPLLEDVADLLESHVFGCPADVWLKAKTADVVLHWMKESETVAAQSCRHILDKGWAGEGETDLHFLPNLSVEELYELLFSKDASAFTAAPTWHSGSKETSAFSRHFDHPLLQRIVAHCGAGLLARHVARLIEIAVVFARLKAGLIDLKNMIGDESFLTQPPHAQTGIGMVEASRGLLVHGVQLDGDTIANYRILAPTEWNFHETGPLVTALANITGHDLERIKMIAELVVPAIDPCTQTKLEARYA